MTTYTLANNPAAVLTRFTLDSLRSELYRLHGNDVDLRVRLSLEVITPGLASYFRSHQDQGLPLHVVSAKKLLTLLRSIPDGCNKNDVFPKLEDARNAGLLRAFRQNDVAYLQPSDTVILDGVASRVRHLFDIHGDITDFVPWSEKLLTRGKPTVVELVDGRKTTVHDIGASHRIVSDEHVGRIMTLRRLRRDISTGLKAHVKAVSNSSDYTEDCVADRVLEANRCLAAVDALLIQESACRSHGKSNSEQCERRNVRLRMKGLEQEIAGRETPDSATPRGGALLSQMLRAELDGCRSWMKANKPGSMQTCGDCSGYGRSQAHGTKVS
jgi:hypothetical protein